MKYTIEVKYHVTKNNYVTKHAATRAYYASDAAACLVSHIRQLAADTDGVITNIVASAAIDHDATLCEFCRTRTNSNYTSSTPPHETVFCCDACFPYERGKFDVD